MRQMKHNEAPEGNQYYEFSITIKYSMKKERKIKRLRMESILLI